MGFFSEIGDFLENPLGYAGESLGKFNQDASKESWDYQTRHSYTNTVYDLRQAGLNPMLAYNNGANSANVSQASVSQLPNFIASAQALANLSKTKAETDLASASAKETEANASVAEGVADYYRNTPGAYATRVQNQDSPKSVTQAVSTIGQKAYNAVRSPQGQQVVKALTGANTSDAKGLATTLNQLGGMIKRWFTGGNGKTTIKTY